MYLDFDNEEKGYKLFKLTRNNVRKNIGEKICFVDKRTIDKYRGYYTVEFGTLHSIHYSRLFLDDGHREVDIRDIRECGIKIK